MHKVRPCVVQVSDKAYWRCVIEALQEQMTIAQIADHMQVDDRQVWRWKSGEREPKGTQAIKLYLLHAERCPNRQCRIGHSAA